MIEDPIPKATIKAKTLFYFLQRKRNQTIRGWYRHLFWSPKLAVIYTKLGSYLRFRSSIPTSDRVFCTLCVAHFLNSEQVWNTHYLLTNDLAVLKAADALSGSLETLDSPHRELAVVVKEFLALNPTQQSKKTLAARYTNAQQVELISLLSFYQGFIFSNQYLFELKSLSRTYDKIGV